MCQLVQEDQSLIPLHLSVIAPLRVNILLMENVRAASKAPLGMERLVFVPLGMPLKIRSVFNVVLSLFTPEDNVLVPLPTLEMESAVLLVLLVAVPAQTLLPA